MLQRILCSWIVLCCGAIAVADDDIQYNRDVRPILSDKCFFCHGPDESHREADLRLDIEEAAKDYAIVPGDTAESEVVNRITHDDHDLRMPPEHSGKELSPGEIDTLTKWIAQGAEYEPYWAYVDPVRHDVPRLRNDEAERNDESGNWIDAFLIHRFAKEGLRLSPEADRVTLLRRLHFDLTGLPPTSADVQRFLADDSPSAYESVVEELLASHRFGERMAMYWLDLVRYADTVGYHGDQDQSISPYRDWVINAFNDGMPFDEFTRKQLAGDLLPDATIEDRIATGYNRLLQTSHEGGVQPKEYLAIYGADRVRNLSSVWMGATMGCCQCHTHKFDPYTITDFYSMQAFFADIDEAKHFKVGGNSLPTNRPPEILVQRREDRDRQGEIENLLRNDESDEAAKLPSPPAGGRGGAVDELKKQRDQLQKEKQRIEARGRKTMVTVAIEPREIRVLPRGDWLNDSGPVVQPSVPKFLDGPSTEAGRLTRLDLANWLVDAEDGAGGLTARVQVNRFWYLLFGVGISKDLDDFGGQGEPPVHPELLDNLAVEFIESGWDVKHMLKLIVMSRAYRQTSVASPELRERDPLNRLYARQSRDRVPAESVRDTLLQISGLLVNEDGGGSVKPYQPEGYYRHLNFPQRKYTADKDSDQWRRGVYVHWQRQFLHPMLKAFDAPTREECTAERPRSNTPLAALVLLNDPTFIEAARKFAERIVIEGGESDDARIEFAFREAVSRTPDETERRVLRELLAQSRARYQQRPEAIEELLDVGLAPVNEKADRTELASWTTVARAVMNMSEVITRE